jgi:hypothetical protein
VSRDPFEEFYKRGMAYGLAGTDGRMHFTFRKEKFKVPFGLVFEAAQYNGHFYQIPIKKLREITEKN